MLGHEILTGSREALADDAIDHGTDKAGRKLGHCGIVVEVEPDHLVVIEANTNEAGSREGNAVALKPRRLNEITLGYLDPARLFGGLMLEF